MEGYQQLWSMARYALLVLFVAASGVALESPRTSGKYRDDYTYSESTKAFYKLHVESADYYQAARVCQTEGATLMVPGSIQDLTVVHAMFKQFPDIGNFVWVQDDGEVHESAEDQAVIKFSAENIADYDALTKSKSCVVLTREGEIEQHPCEYYFELCVLPFVCKVDVGSAPFDAQCGVYSKDYVYKPTVGSCYKVSKTVLSWNQAYSECQQEGAHLVVLNSKAESEVVKQLMTASELLRGAQSPYYYIAGIRANENADHSPGVFRTIFNETLEAAGFAEWAYTEPNNLGGDEFCGSLYESDGKYNDQGCGGRYGFICEKEIGPG